MREIAVGQAQVGDIVAEPVVNDQGRVLLPKGAKLSPAVLSRLQGWGVNELRVEGEDDTEDGDGGDGGALIEALEHRFSEWEGDELMQEIKRVARGHLSGRA